MKKNFNSNKKSFKKREFLKTNKKEVVDYFPRGGAGEDFTYNTAIVDKGAVRANRDDTEKKFLKKKRTKSDQDTQKSLENLDENQIAELTVDTVDKNASRALLPKFRQGDLVLLTVSEIRKDYMIANYTRNKKAMIHKSYAGFSSEKNFSFEKFFKVGQFISGAVVSAGNDIQLSGGRMNKKLLVTIEPKIINTGLHAGNLVIGMDLYGRLRKIGDTYAADFEFTNDEDEIENFAKNAVKNKGKFDFDDDMDYDEDIDYDEDDVIFPDEEAENSNSENDVEEEDDFLEEEISKKNKKQKKDPKPKVNTNFEIVLIDNEDNKVIFNDKITNSYYFFKLVNIETSNDKTILTVSLDLSKNKFQVKKCDFKLLRPGFLFKANQTRELVNGIEVAFGGNIGTIFTDHLKSSDSSSNKNLQSRIIHVSVSKSCASLSSKKNIVSLKVDEIEKKKLLVGKVFNKAKVEKCLYGNSYAVNLIQEEGSESTDSTPISAFLHSCQTENREAKPLLQDEEIEKVLVKEYNFFDDRAMLSAKNNAFENEFFTYDNLTIGKFAKGKIEEIKSDCLILKLNNYILGKLPKEHLSDFPLTKMPKKFKIGQVLPVRIFAYDRRTKHLQFTTKESLMDEKVLLTGDINKISEGQDLSVTYIGNSLFQHSGSVNARLLNFNKLEAKENFKIGKLYNYKVYKLNAKTKKIFLTNLTEVWQPGVGDYENILKRHQILNTVMTLLNSESDLTEVASGSVHEFQILPIKRLIKLLTAKGLDANILSENIEILNKKFLFAKLSVNSSTSTYGIIPQELVSDFHHERISNIFSKAKTNDEILSQKMLVLYTNPVNRALFLTPKRSLVKNMEKIPSFTSTIIPDQLCYAIVNKKAKNGVVVQFLDNDKSLIRLNSSSESDKSNLVSSQSSFSFNTTLASAVGSHFNPGQTVLTRHRLNEKSDKKRFDLNVYYKDFRSLSELKEEAAEYLQSYLNDLSVIVNDKNNLPNLKVNSIVEGKVGMIKEYGVLVSLKTETSNVTGFLKNEHMERDDHSYAIGSSRKFRIIDVDYVDSIVYLTDKLTEQNISENATKEFYTKNKKSKESLNYIIELFHDNYISACLQSNPSVKAIIPCNLYNFNYEASQLSDIYKIGEVININIIEYNSTLDKLVLEAPSKLLTKIQLKGSKSMLTKQSVVPGNIIQGRINGIKNGYVFVYVDKTTLGKIHIQDFLGNIEEVKDKLVNFPHLSNEISLNSSNVSIQVPECLKVKCKVLHVEQKKNVKIADLTNNFSLDSHVLNLTSELDLSGEKANLGIISKIDVNSKYPIKIDHGDVRVTKKAQIHFSHISVENIQNLKSLYKLGEKINFYSKKSENSDDKFDSADKETYVHSLIPFSKITSISHKISLEKVYPVRVLKSIPGRGLVVDLSIFDNHSEAFVDICEISDDLHPNPLQIFKNGALTLGRVLSHDTKTNKYFLSLRASITDEEHYQILKSGSTLKYTKKFESFEKIGDFRNKIFKFGVNSVIENNLVAIGYVTSSSEKGVFIKISNDVIVRAALRELTDEKTTKPYLLYKQDSLVLCRVISIYKPKPEDEKSENSKMNINVSLRESVVKFNLSLRTKDLVQNNFYLCTVMNGNHSESKYKFEVCIVGSTFTGLLKKKNIKPSSLKSIKLAMEKKEYMLLQLVKLDKNAHPPKLRFGNINTDNVEESLIINSISKADQEKNQINAELYENVHMLNEKYRQDEENVELKELEKNADKIDYESLLLKKPLDENEEIEDVEAVEDIHLHQEDSEGELDEEMQMLQDDEEDDENAEIVLDHNIKAQFLKGLGLDLNVLNQGNAGQDKCDEDEDEMELDSESKSESEENENEHAKSSRRREKQHLKQELKIRHKEEATTKFDNKESVEFYEKQILSEPNNSIYWIQYAAYILDKLGLPAARKIFERAITTINISLVKEKLNVWVAYMNLENTYGDSNTFKSVVEKALLVNDKKTVYKHLISIYKLNGKFDLAYEVYKIILKSFFSDFNIWKNYMEFLFEVDQEKNRQTNPSLRSKFESLFPEPKDGMSKALQVLGKNKHVDLLVFFGGLQYKYEYLEEARNTYESILRNFPKRSDIWIVYLDKEIKHGKNLSKVRSTFEKALNVDFKIKILKTLIKKYLEFEKEFGTAKTVDHVKILTGKIISEKMSQFNTEEPEEEHEMVVDDQ